MSVPAPDPVGGEPMAVSDDWLGAILGRPAFRFAFGLHGEPWRKVVKQAPLFAYARVPASETARIEWLEQAGFRVVDVGLTFEANAAALAGPSVPGIRVRDAQASDRDAVYDLALEGFNRSRFHLDPAIPASLANRIKAEWAVNFFAGARGDALLIAENAQGRPAGFLLTLEAGGKTIIDLVAVRAADRGAGLGRAMTLELAQRAHRRGNRLAVGTQAANPGAARFYENLGFRLVSSSIVLHHHRTIPEGAGVSGA